MLFGHQNDDANQSAQTTPIVPDPSANPLAVDPTTGASLPVAPASHASLSQPEEIEPSVLNQAVPPAMPPLDAPVSTAPTVDAATTVSTMPSFDPPASLDAPESVEEIIHPVQDLVPDTTEPASPATTDDSSPVQSEDTDLLSLKQQALAQLSPLVGQLDQTPEERFRTTMMMIQSTDNQSLIKDAYAAAQQISDEKLRAQALLDVVNEINYFTQPKPAN
jgi:hypothetical protein